MALCGWAHAASLGQLQVISQADQNFQATFQVHDVTPTGGSLTARLAPAKTYEQYRVTMPESAKGLKLALINKNPLTLRISGDRPAQERSFPLLVELNEAGKVTVSRYNIFIGASGSVEPVAVSAGPAPISTAKPVAATSAQPVSSATTKTAPATIQPVATKDESSMTPLERMRARNYDLNKPVVVEPGYTPWSLGVLYQSRYPEATVNQVLVALAIHNPNAFPNDDVRSLRAGASLMAPPSSLVNSINQDTAKRIVQQGLSISDVAKEPAPIAKRPVHKESTAKVKKPEAKVETIPTVEPKAPVAESQPEPKPEPIPEVKAPETTPVETMPPAAAVTQPTETVPTEPLPSTEPLPVTEQAPDLAQSEGDAASAQEVMPTLEIMTEEEVVPQEEQTSWLWYVLIVVLLGAAGFIYWRTKQGKQVDFESFKSMINRNRMKEAHEGPSQSMGPVEPTMGAPEASTKPSATAPQTQTYSHPAKTEPVHQVPPSAGASASNVFDLVGEELPLNEEPTVKETPQPITKTPSTPPKEETSNMGDSLAMARSFVAIGAKDEAIQLLQEVLQKGSPADRAEAELMLRQIHNQAS